MTKQETPMFEDARESGRRKVRLASWVEELDGAVSRPVGKLISEVTSGILTSGSLRQSDIARALKQPAHPIAQQRARGYRSENHEVLAIMDEVKRHVRARALWVIDRGRLWEAWLAADREVLVRAANPRHMALG